MPDRVVAMCSRKHNLLPEICVCGREAKVSDGAVSDVVEVELLEGRSMDVTVEMEGYPQSNGLLSITLRSRGRYWRLVSITCEAIGPASKTDGFLFITFEMSSS